MCPLEFDHFRRRPEMRPGTEDVAVAQPNERLLSSAKACGVRDDLVKYRLKSHSRLRHRTQDARHGLVPMAKLIELPDEFVLARVL